MNTSLDLEDMFEVRQDQMSSSGTLSPLSAVSSLELHLQLPNTSHHLVLFLPADPETFQKATECPAAGKG